MGGSRLAHEIRVLVVGELMPPRGQISIGIRYRVGKSFADGGDYQQHLFYQGPVKAMAVRLHFEAIELPIAFSQVLPSRLNPCVPLFLQRVSKTLRQVSLRIPRGD